MQTYRPQADSIWVKNRLRQAFTPFVQRWRDHTAREAAQFIPLNFLDGAMGHVAALALPSVRLALSKAGFDCTLQDNALHVRWPGVAEQLPAALGTLAQGLRHAGLVKGWRNELQAVLAHTDETLGGLERSTFKTLGLRSRAVHVHVQTPGGLIWVGVRAKTKHENPGMLDNLAAGGVAFGESVSSTVLRELHEEAGLTQNDLEWVKPMGTAELTVSRPLPHGDWHHETLYLYRAQTKAGVCPNNLDGEVAKFQLMTASACAAAINQWAFTPDAALCTALAITESQE
ncbi:MAG TPA: NUDIX domain-containing protein [Limnobacter sp.]|nr:NUDIX domain-containing protein [Limnobacter sp.]